MSIVKTMKEKTFNAWRVFKPLIATIFSSILLIILTTVCFYYFTTGFTILSVHSFLYCSFFSFPIFVFFFQAFDCQTFL